MSATCAIPSGWREALTISGSSLFTLGFDRPAGVGSALIGFTEAAIGQTIALESDLVIVAEAADATTARALADGADPSVALVDVLLPDDVTGLALVTSLNQRPGCAVVAMSVRGGVRARALAAGAVAFVEKGGDIDALLAAVRAAAVPRPV